MQFAKDSFYITLRDRLAQVNPERTITANGVAQPAVLLTSTLDPPSAALPKDCFLLSFGAAETARGFARCCEPLMGIACKIRYSTAGTAVDASDRDRALTALDTELLKIAEPPLGAKMDYTQTPPTDLGQQIFWQRPQLGESVDADATLSRTATLTLFFHCEVSQ